MYSDQQGSKYLIAFATIAMYSLEHLVLFIKVKYEN